MSRALAVSLCAVLFWNLPVAEGSTLASGGSAVLSAGGDITLEFSQNIQEARRRLVARQERLEADRAQNRQRHEQGMIGEPEYEARDAELAGQLGSMDTWKLVFDSVTAGLYAPAGSLGGSLAAASPAAAQAIGNYFKEQAAINKLAGKDGLTAGQQVAHVLAHTILGAAVAAAGGNDALTAGLAAGWAEAVAPLISQWLYGQNDPTKLTADQKATISAISGLAGAGIGATTGNMADAVASGQLAQNAVENNRNFTGRERKLFEELYGNNAEAKKRAEAAMCARVKCYEDETIPVDSQEYKDKFAMAEWGETLPEYENPDIDLLGDGLFTYFPKKVLLSAIVDNGGEHVGIHLSDGTQQHLYDPNGGHQPYVANNNEAHVPDTRGSADLFSTTSELRVDFTGYIQYQVDTSSTPPDVYVYGFELSGTDAASIYQNMQYQNIERSCVKDLDIVFSNFYCAYCTTAVIQGIGPFEHLTATRFPGSVKSQLDSIVNKGRGRVLTAEDLLGKARK